MSEPSPEVKKRKEKPQNIVIPPPKPKLSKAERRAIQEQQRAAKAAGGGKRPPLQNEVKKEQSPPDPSTASPVTPETSVPTTTDTNKRQSVSLVSHLPPFRDPAQVFNLIGATLQLSPTVAASTITPTDPSNHPLSLSLHPAVLQLGLDYATNKIRGGNARCRAMLHCFQTLLMDYKPSVESTTDIRHALDHDILKPAFSFWTHSCRPHSVSMGNAFTFLKHAVASLERSMEWNDMLGILQETLQAYERERIDYADLVIADLCLPVLLKQEEVLLTFGYSEAVAVVLKQLAQEENAKVRVILVDSRPLLEGKRLLKVLRQAGMQCSYILLNALSYVLQDVTKVLVGASALMSDGSLLGQVGTGCVALAANAHRIPVLVCCETYKISNKLYLESITHNELGNPDALLPSTHTSEEGEEKRSERLKRLHLRYDLTPAAFVSGIVTELGIIPPTSVAVLLREMNPQDFKKYDD